MGKQVEIKKTVFDRKKFNGVIDSKFKFFIEPEAVVDTDTVEELFRLYDKLYALIQIEGETLSHQYLVERSSELYNIDTQLESIQPLLDEVASLRGQLLEGNRRILELETKLASGGDINFEDGEQMALLRTQLDTANAAIASLEMANTIANQATSQATAAAEAATKKAAEAAEAAAQQASEAEQANTNQGPSPDVSEIIGLFNKKNSSYWNGSRMLSKAGFYAMAFRNLGGYGNYGNMNNYRFKEGVRRYPWLFEDTGNTRYNGQYRYKALFDNINEARRITMKYIVDNLETAGYKAADIVASIEKLGNFRGNVSVRLITYKDPDKEDRTGYNIIGTR